MNNDYEAQRIAQNEMEIGEKLLWAGQPNPGRMAMQSLPILIFAIPWTAFAVFWVTMALSMSARNNAPGAFNFFPLFGLPFVLVGLAMLSAPLWAYRKAATTVYAVSDRRALIITGGGTRSVQSFDAHDMKEVERKERSDGSGDIIFARRIGYSTDSRGYRSNTTTNLGFFGIRDVRNVERLIRDIASQA